MPDYIYLLENRLSADQRHALQVLRDVARDAGIILFLTGDAVRDLTSGHAVRDIEVALQGNALKLKKPLEKSGAKVWGEDETSKSLYLCFPGTVRVDVVSTHKVEYKKLGHPILHAAPILEDLRRRDFTANAMAISLNEGSFGLLIDPLNGAADIEARTLRLASNYGFLEDPALMIRAIRYRTRLGWELDPRTQQRYENAKSEGVIEYLSAHAKSQELEQIGHEDEGFKVLQALEAEGWMKVLFAQWTSAKADLDKLKALHDLSVELLMQGVHADISAAQMQLLTAKMNPKDLTALKKGLLRQGFVQEWNSLDSLAAGFAKVLLAKGNEAPSASYKLFTTYDPEAVLWLGFTSKDKNVQERYNNFLKVWPEMRQKIPHAMMIEMRIKPELPNYNEILHAIFLQLIDGKLETPEEMKAFLEPYSPPAPPPQQTFKRPRGRRGAEPKVKETFEEEEEEGEEEGEEELEGIGAGDDEDEIGLGMPKIGLAAEGEDLEEGEDEEEEEEEEEAPAKRGKGAGKAVKEAPAAKGAKAEKGAPAKPAAAPGKPAAAAAKPAHAPAKPAAVPAKHPAASDKHVAAGAKHAAAPAKHAPAPDKHAAKPAGHKPEAPHKPAHAAPAAKGKPAAKVSHHAHPAPKHKPAAKAPAAKHPVKKAALKPHAKPAHKSIPKAAPKKAGAKVKAKPVSKTKPHKAAKPVAKKVAKKK
ncbi:MAG TPA: hypothetical protein VKB38_19605 [Terracidiphilus sp.]|nr:hypothetical protein [Terracidiphilus sp.]